MSVVTPRRPHEEAALGPASPAKCGSVAQAPLSPLLVSVLREAGTPLRVYREAAEAAEANGSDAAEELIASGAITAEELAAAIAATVGLSHGTPGPEDRIVELPSDHGTRHLRTCTLGLEAKIFIAPRLDTLDELAVWIAEREAGRIVVTTSAALRQHRARQSDRHRLREACFALPAERPEWSARTVLTAAQGYGLGVGSCAVVLLAAWFGATLWTGIHIVLSFFFCACTIFRLCVLLDFDAEQKRKAKEREKRENELRLPVGQLPVYTVLVALYREVEMVDPLVDSLLALNWPRSRLDVKLVCEADDLETVAAVSRRIAGEAGVELVQVPPSAPRTKPKALNHALPLARGELLVLYDAEDRPDPDQLLEAWLAFSTGERRLACVQAPLVIRNGEHNWLSGMFALEYAVLFRALLPFLARRGLPIPLGGTSNHFRCDVLRSIGGWDSHNVAEDADLGIRLARLGYRTDVIAAPTSEIAPERWRDWRNQRTRWIKGWIQTYLVHMRQPFVALRELGVLRMTAFQVLFASMVAGAVMHTAFVIHLMVTAAILMLGGSPSLGPNWLMLVDAFNITAAGIVFTLLASKALAPDERGMMRWLWGLWLYWLLFSVAGARSALQLFAAPHQWEKTPHHEPAQTAEAALRTGARV